MRVILASASPRRMGLLSALGFEVTVMPPRCDETPVLGESPEQLVQRLATAKACNVLAEIDSDLQRQRRNGHIDAPGGHAIERGTPVIAADTVVVSQGSILGKPTDDDHAKRLLRTLSGAVHEVVSGYAIRRFGIDHDRFVGVEVSMVKFRALTPEQIAAYVATGEGRDKAGAYGIQGLGAALVQSVDGSYSNVVGLPLEGVLAVLARL